LLELGEEERDQANSGMLGGYRAVTAQRLHGEIQVERTFLCDAWQGELLAPCVQQSTPFVDQAGISECFTTAGHSHRECVLAVLAEQVLVDRRCTVLAAFFVRPKAKDDPSAWLELGRLEEVLDGAENRDKGGLCVGRASSPDVLSVKVAAEGRLLPLRQRVSQDGYYVQVRGKEDRLERRVGSRPFIDECEVVYRLVERFVTRVSEAGASGRTPEGKSSQGLRSAQLSRGQAR